MSREVIRVENVSKLYRLGQIGTGTLSKDLNRWWARVRGKEDPYARIGQRNDRTQRAAKGNTVWALQDINFSINEGDLVGIIGRNGAGKSTLLKIISRITTPTSGSVKIKGRIASLLEVGTGFHPEMTGRENVFMNGTLLGMTRREIQTKLDEIIDFAGVAMYIDTPVKRYSSGMQVRLAFAVGAFLEPEILIVDEVLAVGDAEFQKKAIGKMQDVSKGQGRTVLFVSHNMGAVSQICKLGIIIKEGLMFYQGTANDAISKYLKFSSESNTRFIRSNTDLTTDKPIYLKELVVKDANNNLVNSFSHDKPFIVETSFFIDNDILKKKRHLLLITLLDKNKNCVFSAETTLDAFQKRLKIEPNFLARGVYSLRVIIYIPAVEVADNVFDIGEFTIIDGGSEFAKLDNFEYGVVFGKYEWQ